MITVQVESFADALPELREIFPRHHDELGLFKDRMPLRPQFDQYVERERDGRLFLVTVRKNGEIVGYHTVQVQPGFHYADTLTGTTDMYYVVPEERGKGMVLPLFRQTEKELRRRGAQVWYSGFKTHKPLNMPGVLDALGFQPADQYKAKWIGT